MQISETYGVIHKRRFILQSSQKVLTIEDDEKSLSLKAFLTALFLPHGYPESVSSDYLQYQFWDSVQAFASSINGGFCTHAILKGVGVGNESSSPIAATITWLLKDGSSMMGRIGFAWLQGTRLDSECKKWRLFADVMNDAAMFLDLTSGYFKDYFLPIVCISGVLKAVVGVSGSCTRAALTQHQARKNNMADVSAKDGSQETLVNLLALIFNLALIPIVSENHVLVWYLFIVLTFIHLMANYLAVKSVVMEIFNEERFRIYASHFLNEGRKRKNFLSVDQVNEKENVFFFSFSSSITVKLGVSFSEIIKDKKYKEIKELLEIYKDCNYILIYSKKNSKGLISVVFNKAVSTETQIEAFFQACCIMHILEQKCTFSMGYGQNLSLEASSRNLTKKVLMEFLASLQKMKFNTNVVIFNVDLWRLEY